MSAFPFLLGCGTDIFAVLKSECDFKTCRISSWWFIVVLAEYERVNSWGQLRHLVLVLEVMACPVSGVVEVSGDPVARIFGKRGRWTPIYRNLVLLLLHSNVVENQDALFGKWLSLAKVFS